MKVARSEQRERSQKLGHDVDLSRRESGLDGPSRMIGGLQKLAGPFSIFLRYESARRKIIPVMARIILLYVNRAFNRSFPFALFKNIKLYARFDFGSPIVAYYLGLYEESSMNFLIRYLRPEDTFADIGANVGVYAVLASGAAGARVHAFEPFSVACDALEQNVSLNALGERVMLHRRGVGSRTGEAFITTTRKSANRIVDANAKEAVEKIDVVRLDDALGEDVPAAIKIDVEGYEERVLVGAQQILSSKENNVVIFEGISRNVDSRNHVNRCISILKQFGFRMCTFDPSTDSLKECPRGVSEFVGPNDENYLFVKDMEKTLRRLSEKIR